MRTLFVTLFILGGFIAGFYILWMNMTPGHFQKTCPCGTVLYVSDAQLKNLQENVCAYSTGGCPDSKATKTMGDISLWLSQFDYYR